MNREFAVKHQKTALEKYAVAIGIVGIAFALRYALHDTLGPRIPFAFFTLSTLISAWYGGLGPGMLAAASGLVLADFFFMPPHSPEGLGETERTSIGIYAMTNTLIVVLFWNLHTKLRDAEYELCKRDGARLKDDVVSRANGDTPGHVRPL
jgi:K+-sensing histidine kinase KdpD